MPTLNRFPLLGLWAEEAARRVGYTKDEAEAFGHAYAVLYAIRANRRPHAEQPDGKEGMSARRRRVKAERLHFAGDDLDVTYADGKVRGLVGGDRPQTPESYRRSVEKRFPLGYYDRLQKSFRRVLKTYPPRRLQQGRLVYDLYDEWKKRCGVGRRVDLDRLLDWCEERVEGEMAAR
jgi:hypothetical protein